MYHKLADREWLYEQYVTNLRSLQSIADEIGCTKHTVMRACVKLRIERRKRTSKHRKINDKEWLRTSYLVYLKSIAAIAREANCTPGVVRDALLALGIETRDNKEAWRLENGEPGNRLGEHAHNWQGGSIRWTREELLKEVGHCERCGFDDARALVMHHKNRNRRNNSRDNTELLCCNCHSIEHYNAKDGVFHTMR